jgi:hypothetical protein
VSRRAAPRPLPYDEAAEAALVGGALVWPDRIEAVAADVAPSDFYVPLHAALWQAIGSLLAEGTKLDAVVVADRLQRSVGSCDNEALLALSVDALPPQRELAVIVLRHAAARRALGVVRELEAGIGDTGDPYALAAGAAADLDAVSLAANGERVEALTMEELVARTDTAAPWIIPGLMRRDWRVLVVAAEGVGKSTLLRQLGVCAAQGIHPLRHDAMEPVRVLIVDAENSMAAIAETGSRLDAEARRHAGDGYDAGRLRIWCRPGGLDLRNPKVRGALVSELRHQRPQLVCAGPLYKLGRSKERESYEEAAEAVQQVWDDLRVRFEFGLVLEHHAPKAAGGSYRPMAPFGSQRWLAWPELGIGLCAERDGSGLRLTRFRGDRMASSWPDRLVRDDIWPFVGVWEGKGRSAVASRSTGART